MSQKTDFDPVLPLSGMRVIELSNGKTDMAGRLLSDLGAEVLLVEPPEGAEVRGVPPMHQDQSLYFATHHANKLSVVIDLTTAAGVERFLSLIDTCDLLIDGSQPGILDKLHGGGETLRQRRPELAVLSISDFGLTGPYRNYRASHIVHTAMAGVLSRSGMPGLTPLMPPGSLTWEASAIQAAFAGLLAYWQRLQNGRGDHLDFSIHEAVAQTIDPGLGATGSANGGKSALDTTPAGRPQPMPLYPIIPCLDGHVRLCVLNPRQWSAMSDWLGAEHPYRDPAFAQIGKRMSEVAAINAEISRLFVGYSKQDLVIEGQKRGVPIAALLTPGEVLRDEHFKARKAFMPLEVAPGITGQVPSGYLEIDGIRMGIRQAAPTLGQADGFLAAWFNPSITAIDCPDDRVRPLAGVRVLDLGVIVAGAEAGRLLADQGADVIKVENNAFPDGGRQSVSGDHMTPSVALGHRNKRSIGINLRQEKGRELFKSLVAQSDVVLSNFKPGTLASLGLGTDVLLALNPRLIMMDSSALGNTGPRSRSMGYGPLVRAVSGLTSVWRYPDVEGSFSDGVTVYPDHVAGRVAALGVLALLIRRERTGHGGCVSISQAEIFLNGSAEHFLRESLQPGTFIARGNQSDDRVPEGVYPCAGDDQWCAISIETDEQFKELLNVIGRQDLLDDRQLSTLKGRRLRRSELDELVASFSRSHAPRELTRLLQKVQVPAGFMQRLTEYRDDPQFQSRAFIRTLCHDGLPLPLPAENRIVNSLHMLDPDLRPAPYMSEHTREIAIELLGLSDFQIDELLATGDLEVSQAPTKHS